MIIGAAVADGKVTPKVQSLIKILLKYQQTEDFRAIIFVERVVSALVLPKVDMLIHDFLFAFIDLVFQVCHSILLYSSKNAGICRASISKFY